ncbi:NAD(P)-dependent oxidoreductase (plasmid) [Paraburkholderia sp. PREW-6R]|uniref:NAD(P)-dependent oxidoreductase n=1 Tax=Paraburkholderia sp. PREW-6R TaxID=3141544 RepID=UPI0031F4E941
MTDKQYRRNPETDMQKVGFIGIGNMGWPMAANVAKAGYPLTVFDTDPQRSEQFVSDQTGDGRSNVNSVSAIHGLASCDVIVTMLPTGKIVSDALTQGGDDSLAARLTKGAIIVDMSSSEPTGTRDLAAKLAKHEVILIDAPVSGGVPRALAGTLSIMIGADDAPALELVTPLLQAMGDRLFITGGLGCGHAMKALNNYVAATCYTATAEAMLIGEKFGLDLTTMVDIMNVSTARNFFTDIVMKDHVIGEKYATGFAVGLLAKDVKIAADLSEAVGLPLPVLQLVTERWALARDTLGGQRDNSEAIVAWKETAER